MAARASFPGLTARTVRIQIPASVAFDLGRFNRAIGNLVEAIGCKPCFSGVDCAFQQERAFVVDPSTLKIDTLPMPDRPAIGTWPTPERWATVSVPREVAYDLGKVQSVVKTVMGRLGCPACTSGFDILFRLERDFLVDAKTLALGSVRGGIIVDS